MDPRLRSPAVPVAVAAVALLAGCSLFTDLSGLEGDEGAVDAGTTAGDGGSPSGSGDAGGGSSGTPATPSEAGADASGGCTPSGMVETVTASPGEAADDARGGTIAWTAPQNVRLPDALSAKINLSGTVVSHWLLASHFAAAVPPKALVRGFTVKVKRSAGFADEIADEGVALVRAGVPGQTKRISPGTWPARVEVATYGGATDTWGASFTDAEVRADDFGVAFAVRGAPAYQEDAWVDHIELTVHFERCKP